MKNFLKPLLKMPETRLKVLVGGNVFALCRGVRRRCAGGRFASNGSTPRSHVHGTVANLRKQVSVETNFSRLKCYVL